MNLLLNSVNFFYYREKFVLLNKLVFSRFMIFFERFDDGRFGIVELMFRYRENVVIFKLKISRK